MLIKRFSLYTPRGIPLSLREEVKQELHKMGSNIESGQTNRVVQRNGYDFEEVRSNQNLCGPVVTEFQCPEGNTLAQGQKCSVNWMQTQANPTGRKLATIDHFHHSLWQILLLTNSPLESQAPQSISKNIWRKSSRDSKVLCVRWIVFART